MTRSIEEKQIHWMEQVRAEEHRKISQDLNDYLLQALISIDQQIADLQKQTSAQDEQSLGHLQKQVHNILDMTRSICSDLRPYTSQNSGLLATLQTWLGMLERRGVFHVTLGTEGDIDQLPQDVALCLFNVLQEALANIQKHAGADHVAVQIRMHGDQMQLTVEDNGQGFAVPQNLEGLLAQQRFGLVGMQTRVSQMRGTMQLRSTRGQGTQLQVFIPYFWEGSAPQSRAQTQAQPQQSRGQRSGVLAPLTSLRVVIADDHPVVRAGIRNELAQHPDIEIIGETTTTDDTLSYAKRVQPDAVLLDISMPGMACNLLIQQLMALPRPPRVLILTAHNDLDHMMTVMKAGATGYLLKDEDLSAVPTALRTVAQGGTWLSSTVAPLLFGFSGGEPAEALELLLSDSELKVVRLLSAGKNNREIGSMLNISERTVRFHLTNIYDKLRMRRSEVIAWGVMRGLSSAD
jgi:DNA-binding NarL/FixJ family response regulator/two-component sensor histidine kinase